MKKRLALLTLFFFVFSFVFTAVPTAYAAGLTDLKGHWAETLVQQMVNEGLISGYPIIPLSRTQHYPGWCHYSGKSFCS